MAVVSAALSLPALWHAAAAEPYWQAVTDQRQIKIGYVVPDYAAEEFTVFWMSCADDGVKAVVDLGGEIITKAGKYDVEVIVDGRPHPLAGQAIHSEMLGYALYEAALEADAPLLAALGDARSLAIRAEGRTLDLRTTGLGDGMETFLTACRNR